MCLCFSSQSFVTILRMGASVGFWSLAWRVIHVTCDGEVLWCVSVSCRNPVFPAPAPLYSDEVVLARLGYARHAVQTITWLSSSNETHGNSFIHFAEKPLLTVAGDAEVDFGLLLVGAGVGLLAGAVDVEADGAVDAAAADDVEAGCIEAGCVEEEVLALLDGGSCSLVAFAHSK